MRWGEGRIQVAAIWSAELLIKKKLIFFSQEFFNH